MDGAGDSDEATTAVRDAGACRATEATATGTSQAGRIRETTGRSSRHTSTDIHTRWRAAADARRMNSICTIAAKPANAVAFTINHSTVAKVESANQMVIVRLPVHGRASAGCSDAGTQMPTAESHGYRAMPQLPNPVNC